MHRVTRKTATSSMAHDCESRQCPAAKNRANSSKLCNSFANSSRGRAGDPQLSQIPQIGRNPEKMKSAESVQSVDRFLPLVILLPLLEFLHRLVGLLPGALGLHTGNGFVRPRFFGGHHGFAF